MSHGRACHRSRTTDGLLREIAALSFQLSAALGRVAEVETALRTLTEAVRDADAYRVKQALLVSDQAMIAEVL